MPSAYPRARSPHIWISFTGPRGPDGKRHRVQGKIEGASQTEAYQIALRLEKISRMIETAAEPRAFLPEFDQYDIKFKPEVRALYDQAYTPPPSRREDPTIMHAAIRHPSSRRMEKSEPENYNISVKYLEEFSEVTGIHYLKDLQINHALVFVEYMKNERTPPLKYRSRVRALHFLKRASAMAPSYGLPDRLNKIRLDSDDEERDEVPTIPDDDLRKFIEAAVQSSDTRLAAAIGVQAFLGLRPSEAARLEVEDINRGMLYVAWRKKKNVPSKRVLPIPGTLEEWILRAAGDRASGPLFPGEAVYRKSAGTMMAPRDFGRYVGKHLGEYQSRFLRKTFTTIAADSLELDPRDIEAFLGHHAAGFADVTNRSYLARRQAEKLRPAAEKIDQFIRDLLHPQLQST